MLIGEIKALNDVKNDETRQMNSRWLVTRVIGLSRVGMARILVIETLHTRLTNSGDPCHK